MKRIVFGMFLVALTPCLIRAQVNYTLSGKIGSLSAPAKIYLRYSAAGNTVSDSTILQDGQFEFKGSIAGPVRASLVLYPQGVRTGRNADALTLYLENGSIKLSSSDSVMHAVITGSKLNDDNKRLQVALQPVMAKDKALMAEYYTYTPEQKKDKDFMAPFAEKNKAIDQEIKQVYRKFIQDNPNTFVSLDNIRMAVGAVPSYNDIASLYGSLSPAVKNSPEGKLFAEKLEKLKATDVGMTAPDFTQNDTNGMPVTLSSFRGKYVLVDFWASWCGPCRAENPTVVKTYQKYKDKNFTIVGVSLDQPGAKEKWLKAIADDHLDWTQVSDLQFWNNAVAKLYEVQAIPQNFLVGPDGKIVAKNLRGEELEKKLSEFIN